MITLTPVVTVAAGALAWMLGLYLLKNIKLLAKYNLPPPVVGGLIIALILTIFHHYKFYSVTFSKELVNPLMIGFFTSLGFGASIKELKAGGKAVLVFLIACSILLIAQATLGAITAYFCGKPALFGVLTSAVALVGGPGTALSFAADFEKAGVSDAATAGLTAAMVGIIIGGLLGSPVATHLIEKNKLHSKLNSYTKNQTEEPVLKITGSELASSLLYHTAWLLIIGSAGWYLSDFLKEAGIRLPFYIGSMIAASVIRNIDDYFKIFKLNSDMIDAIGGTCLTLFISVSMLTLELWNIGEIAGPLLIILIFQTLLVAGVAATIIFRISGKDYDAAVTSGGMIGFMMGTTANALATMNSITGKYGPAPKAYLIIPLVGACFIDFINAIVISIALNILSF